MHKLSVGGTLYSNAQKRQGFDLMDMKTGEWIEGPTVGLVNRDNPVVHTQSAAVYACGCTNIFNDEE